MRRAIFTLACTAVLFVDLANSAAAQNSPSPMPRAAKHVWTNDDVEALRGRAPVSVFGEAPSAPSASPSRASTDAFAKAQHQRDQQAQRYRRQLQPLYAELPQIENEIAEMRRWQSGSYEMTGVWPLRFAGMPLNPADRIAQLEAHEREVRVRIGSLEDEARHAGVLPGELR